MERVYLKSGISIFLSLLIVSCSIEPLTESQNTGIKYEEVYESTGTFFDIEKNRILFGGYISYNASYLNITNLTNKEIEFMDTFYYNISKAFMHDSFLIILTTENQLFLYSIPQRIFVDFMYINDIFKMDSIFIFNKSKNIYALNIKENRFNTISSFTVVDSFKIEDVYKNYVLISTANYLLVLKYDGTLNSFSVKTKESSYAFGVLNDNYIINLYYSPHTLEFLSIKGGEKREYYFFDVLSMKGYKESVFIVFKPYDFYSIGIFKIKKGRLIEYPIELSVFPLNYKIRKITDNYLILQGSFVFTIYTQK